MGIVLQFIPPGLTDEFQPLDRLVFGALKATAKHLFQQAYWQDPRHVFNRQSASQHMIQAWNRLQSHVIEEAWDIYE
jgi:hypothetical protein